LVFHLKSFASDERKPKWLFYPKTDNLFKLKAILEEYAKQEDLGYGNNLS
jgi:hypothetical protein